VICTLGLVESLSSSLGKYCGLMPNLFIPVLMAIWKLVGVVMLESEKSGLDMV